MTYEYSPVRDILEIDAALREIEVALDPGKDFAPTYQNSWADYGSGYAPVTFRKDGTGIVHLQGVMAGGTLGSAAFTLPKGHRPAADLKFVVSSNNGFGEVEVQTDGGVVVDAGANNTYVSLSGIFFRSIRT